MEPEYLVGDKVLIKPLKLNSGMLDTTKRNPYYWFGKVVTIHSVKKDRNYGFVYRIKEDNSDINNKLLGPGSREDKRKHGWPWYEKDIACVIEHYDYSHGKSVVENNVNDIKFKMPLYKKGDSVILGSFKQSNYNKGVKEWAGKTITIVRVQKVSEVFTYYSKWDGIPWEHKDILGLAEA